MQAPTKPRAKREIPLRRKLAYVAFCIVLTLLLAELVLRVRGWIRYGTTSPLAQTAVYKFDEKFQMTVPIPGRELHGSKINVKINSLGFRGDELSLEKPANTLRVACIGASTTYCPEVSSNDAAWPARLQALLRTRYPQIQVEVINAGIQGIQASDSLKNLKYRVLPLRPDVVIFYEAHNDLAWDTRQLAKQQGLIADESGRQSGVIRFLSDKSLLFNLVSRNLALAFANHDSNAGRLNSLPPDLPEHFIAQLRAMHELLSANKIPFVLSRFLVKFRRTQPRATEIANAQFAVFYLPWLSLDALLDGFDLYNNAIMQFAHASGIPVVEDDDAVPGDADHYVDHVHFSDAGCKAMAERFDRFLAEQKIIDPIVARIESTKQ
jgi:lysophospholipase L1-like esterase